MLAAGVLDLVAGAEARLGDGAVQALVGGEPQEMPERYAAASPIALVSPPVPVTVIHGADDDIVPVSQSERYVEAVNAAGGAATLRILPDADHFDIIDPESHAWPDVVAEVAMLLRR